MISGICGAQSTGKTTLVNLLESMGYKIYKNVARTVMADHPINKDGDDDTQRAIFGTHLYNLDAAKREGGTAFMDRCLVDGFVFSLYGLKHGKVTGEAFAEFYELFYNNIKRYDYIFYLKPEFDIVPDGVRDEDNEFRNELCKLYELVLKSLDIPVIWLKGTPSERAQACVLTVGEFKC